MVGRWRKAYFALRASPNHLSCAIALTLLATGVAASAAAQDKAAEGRSIAYRWCSSCHLVGPEDAVSDGAPTFSQIAKDPYFTSDRLRGWLAAPHEPMPDLELSRQEIDALVAYLQSLRAD